MKNSHISGSLRQGLRGRKLNQVFLTAKYTKFSKGRKANITGNQSFAILGFEGKSSIAPSPLREGWDGGFHSESYFVDVLKIHFGW